MDLDKFKLQDTSDLFGDTKGTPKAEEPKAEEPKAEEPKAEEPKAEEPKGEKVDPKIKQFELKDTSDLFGKNEKTSPVDDNRTPLQYSYDKDIVKPTKSREEWVSELRNSSTPKDTLKKFQAEYGYGRDPDVVNALGDSLYKIETGAPKEVEKTSEGKGLASQVVEGLYGLGKGLYDEAKNVGKVAKYGDKQAAAELTSLPNTVLQRNFDSLKNVGRWTESMGQKLPGVTPETRVITKINNIFDELGEEKTLDDIASGKTTAFGGNVPVLKYGSVETSKFYDRLKDSPAWKNASPEDKEKVLIDANVAQSVAGLLDVPTLIATAPFAAAGGVLSKAALSGASRLATAGLSKVAPKVAQASAEGSVAGGIGEAAQGLGKTASKYGTKALIYAPMALPFNPLLAAKGVAGGVASKLVGEGLKATGTALKDVTSVPARAINKAAEVSGRVLEGGVEGAGAGAGGGLGISVTDPDWDIKSDEEKAKDIATGLVMGAAGSGISAFRNPIKPKSTTETKANGGTTETKANGGSAVPETPSQPTVKRSNESLANFKDLSSYKTTVQSIQAAYAKAVKEGDQKLAKKWGELLIKANNASPQTIVEHHNNFNKTMQNIENVAQSVGASHIELLTADEMSKAPSGSLPINVTAAQEAAIKNGTTIYHEIQSQAVKHIGEFVAEKAASEAPKGAVKSKPQQINPNSPLSKASVAAGLSKHDPEIAAQAIGALTSGVNIPEKRARALVASSPVSSDVASLVSNAINIYRGETTKVVEVPKVDPTPTSPDIKSEIKKTKSGEAGFLDLQPLQEFGKSIYSAGKDFVAWSKEMITKFGEAVKEHLYDIWDRLTNETGAVGDVTTKGVKRIEENSSGGKERLSAAAYRDPNTGEIYIGPDHKTALEKAKAAGATVPEVDTTKPENRETPEFGFVDNGGKFHSREDAEDIAQKSGQLKGEKEGDLLHSSDVKQESEFSKANEPLQGSPYRINSGRTGKWKITDKKGNQAFSKTFSNPEDAADYAIARHRETQPLARVKKLLPKADRVAIEEAEQRISDIQTKNPEATPLEVARDRETGLPKIDLLEDADGNPILDEKGKQKRGVIYKQVPYKLRQSPKIDTKDDAVATKQAADLMEQEVKQAMADPSVKNALGWYSNMRQKLQRDFGANIELFGQLLGATSARTPVDENYKQTLEAARQYSKGSYDDLLKRFHDHIETAQKDLASGELQKAWEKKNPNKKWSDAEAKDALRKEINKFEEVPLRSNGKKFNANSQKVLHALYGNWLDQTVGPKTPNFAGNLTGRTLKATIDVWAARNLRRLLYDDGKSQWRVLPEQEKGVDSSYNSKGELTGDFPFAQNVYDEVAKRVGMSPDDLQALMWFHEKGIWDKNGWTGSAGAKKSSFEEESAKHALDRYQAGVTAYTNPSDYPEVSKFREGRQKDVRKDIRKTIGEIPGVEISRVTHSDGLYGGDVEPTLDVEFSVSRGKDGKTKSIAPFVEKLKEVGKADNQNDVFVSQVVDAEHPNARPMAEVGFKSPAKPEEIQAVIKSFRDAGIDGFTLAKDSRGNVIGIRAQYIPEISSRWDKDVRAAILNHENHPDRGGEWVDKSRKAIESLADQENVSYTNEGYVSTHVYGKEEYDSATKAPDDLLGLNIKDELERRSKLKFHTD
jgi:hypothetical protein